MPSVSHLPERLRHHRRLQGLSQGELAQRSLVSIRTIARIEAGYDRANAGTIRLLADALGITAEQLIEPNGEEAA